MTSTQIDAVIRDYLVLGPEGRRTDPRIGRDRHTLIMSGAAILQALDADLADRPAVGRRPGPARGAAICTDERGWRSGRRALQMTEKNTSGRGQRELRVRVKTAKGRKLSSTLWLERQLNDPYVQRAKREGYRGRAAYKILELDDKYGFLKPGARVVDLGCAPGGWCQVAVVRVNALGQNPKKRCGPVLGVDLQEVEPIAGAEIHQLDFWPMMPTKR
jgi:hypothetical protein